MSFAENLKSIRKSRNLSQEELAELMDVSRQAVSKWEQGESYPEVEKLLLLSKRFNISLDSLLSAEIVPGNNTSLVTGSIVITSPNENVILTCCKVASSQKMSGGKKSPRYALFGVGNGGFTYWGEPTTFLGWYADQEQISKEIAQIQRAIAQGIPAYTLQYGARVERKWMRMVMIED